MIGKLQHAIQNSDKLDGALILSPENRRYYTGFDSTDGFLLVSAEKAIFITDSRYVEAAQKQVVADCEVRLQGDTYSQLLETLLELGVQSVGVEASRLTLAQYAVLKEKLEPLYVVADTTLDAMITEQRMVKTPQEIEKILQAQRIAEDAFTHICQFIKPGKTEKEVALELDFYMLSHGAEALSFQTIAITGTKTSMPHGVPDDTVIQNGDFVTMDYGAVVDGYHSDMTRTVAVGSVSEEQKKVYEIVLEAQKAVCDGVKAGMRGTEGDALARDIIGAAGYGAYFGHGTGHGVGVEIHEEPRLSLAGHRILQENNVVTSEPGIYLPGKFGVRIEDMLRITKDGAQNLTKCPKELIIL